MLAIPQHWLRNPLLMAHLKRSPGGHLTRTDSGNLAKCGCVGVAIQVTGLGASSTCAATDCTDANATYLISHPYTLDCIYYADCTTGGTIYYTYILVEYNSTCGLVVYVISHRYRILFEAWTKVATFGAIDVSSVSAPYSIPLSSTNTFQSLPFDGCTALPVEVTPTTSQPADTEFCDFTSLAVELV
ncbi:MAG: hypothetical protein KDB22_26580 [Planctomycetales bacterium]|nr:hypothetical protein [Planctomycetales bacterium]